MRPLTRTVSPEKLEEFATVLAGLAPGDLRGLEAHELNRACHP